MSVNKHKVLITQLESMKQELEEELDVSEESRKRFKKDLEDANIKITTLEEDIFESKTIQLELLENLKEVENKYDEILKLHENIDSVIEKKYTDRILFMREKIEEL